MLKTRAWPRQRAAEELLLEMLREGYSVEEIEAELGYKRGQIYQARKKLKKKKTSNKL